MSTWIVFIPRDQANAKAKDSSGNAEGLFGEAKSWVNDSDGKLDEQNIYFSTDTLPAPLVASAATTLYVMGGHGKEGRNYLTWPGESNPLCCHQLGDLIQAAGVPKAYSGSIKVYSCLSADNAGSSVAFAKAFAEYMASLGYVSCRIYGYTGAVSKSYVNSGTEATPLGGVAKLKFKVQSELGKGRHRYALTTGGWGTRAKEAKRDFTVKPGVTPVIKACATCQRFG